MNKMIVAVGLAVAWVSGAARAWISVNPIFSSGYGVV